MLSRTLRGSKKRRRNRRIGCKEQAMITNAVGRRLFDSVAVTLVWWPASLLTILNYYHYSQQHVFLAFSRSLGLSHSDEMTTGQFLLVFGKTFMMIGVAFPVITILAAYFFKLRATARVVLACSICLVFLNYVNLLSVGNTGSLMT